MVRVKAAKARELDKKFALKGNENVEELIPIPKEIAMRDIDDGKLVHPYDPEFWFNMNTGYLEEPKLEIPKVHDPLFVTRPIGPYVRGRGRCERCGR